MKMILSVSFPHDVFNAAVRDGTAGSKLNRILEATKPDAVYFTEVNGRRGAVMVLDMSDGSKIPSYAEPWMLTFGADIQFQPVMTADELKSAGLDDLGKKWG
jgi:hypothetical protein